MLGLRFFEGTAVSTYVDRIRAISARQPYFTTLPSAGEYVLCIELPEEGYDTYHCVVEITITGPRMKFTRKCTVSGNQRFAMEFSGALNDIVACRFHARSKVHHTPISAAVIQRATNNIAAPQTLTPDDVVNGYRLKKFLSNGGSPNAIAVNCEVLSDITRYMASKKPGDYRSEMNIKDFWQRFSTAATFEDEQPSLLHCAAYACCEPAVILLIQAGVEKRALTNRTRTTAFDKCSLTYPNSPAVRRLLWWNADVEPPTINPPLPSSVPTIPYEYPEFEAFSGCYAGQRGLTDNRQNIVGAMATTATTDVRATRVTFQESPARVGAHQICKVIANVNGRTAGELSALKGDIVRTLEEPGSDGWTKCLKLKIAGEVGYLPSWSIVPIHDRATSASDQQNLLQAAAASAVLSATRTQLPVTTTTTLRATTSATNAVAAQTYPQSSYTDQYRVTRSFQSQGPGEMTVRFGQVVTGAGEPPTYDGWFKVKNSQPSTNGNVINYGFVPFSYIRSVNEPGRKPASDMGRTSAANADVEEEKHSEMTTRQESFTA
jgi:hypothetical protein